MSRQDPEPRGNSGGILLAVLAAGAVLWLTVQEPAPEPVQPEITVNVEAPVIEGDTITVEPAPVMVAPAEVTVNVDALPATPGEPPRSLTVIEQAQQLAWRCVVSAVAGPVGCLWQLVEAAR